MLNRAEMKANARLSMRGRKPSVYLVTLAVYVIFFVLSSLSIRLQYPGLQLWESSQSGYVFAWPTYTGVNVFGGILVIAIALMDAVISVGLTNYCLRVSRGQAASFGDVFDVFGIFFKVIWLNIVTSVFIWLWSLLFVIPGIVAAYRYSMAMFILLDDPELSVMECIRRSKEMTMGYKGTLFVLDLSFIGWNILTAIPFVSLFVLPYTQITWANYYNALSAYRPEPECNDQPGQGYDNTRDPWDR